MFPVNQFPAIEAHPEDYRLLSRIPWTKEDVEFPVIVSEAVGDEVPLVILDVETTGFQAGQDRIIELGLVKALVSPSTGRVTRIVAAASMYEDPGFEIPEIITDITGITQDMVAGQSLDVEAVSGWFEGDPIVVAHNAAFDKAFWLARFPPHHYPVLGSLRWACSIKDIPWQALGYEGNKLEYLCLKQGGYYVGHRASVDCLALTWLLDQVPAATQALLRAEAKIRAKVEAFGCPFEMKDALKARGYRWKPEAKVWHTEVDGEDLEAEKDYLSKLYYHGGSKARVTEMSSRDRYAPDA